MARKLGAGDRYDGERRPGSRSDFFTIDEVAARAHLSRRTVERALSTGALPYYRHGRRKVLIKRHDYDAWMAESTRFVRGQPRDHKR